jgi:hypothetical protein
LAISGPEWVNAKAYPGANLITWAFTKDAQSYTVYRQRSDGSDALTLLANTSSQSSASVSFSHLDVVSFDNQLVDQVGYTYYVTANSGQSATSRALKADGATLINDGASSTGVTANIPARTTAVTKLVLDPANELKVDSITPEQVKSSSGDILLVTWPNHNPAFSYTVKYDLGKALTLNLTPANSEDNVAGNGSPDTEGWDVTRYYRAPLFGGTNTLRITVSLGEDEYYYKPVELSKELPAYALTQLPSPTFIQNNPITRSGTGADITWTPATGASKDTVYKLYRIEAKGISTTNAYSGSQVEVVGDWVAVTGAPVLSGTALTVTDTGLDLTKGYLYALYAETGTGANPAKSLPTLYGLAPAAAPANTLSVVSTYTTNTAGDRDYSVTIGWTAQEGAAYKLERALTTTYPNAIGTFTEIALPATIAGRYTVLDTPAIRNSYIYRLTVTLEGTTTIFEEALDDAPFREYVNSSISVASTNISTAYATDVTISGLGYDNDLAVDIYRAEADSSVSTGNYTTAVGKLNFTKIKENFSLKDSNTYTDEGLKIGTKYVYRHVVKAGGKELYNTNENHLAKAGWVQIPSVPTLNNVQSLSLSGSNNATYYYKVSVRYGIILSGTKVQLQSRALNATADAPWVSGTDSTVTQFTGTTPPTGSNLSDDDYYVTLTKPANAANFSYRIVLVDQEGTTASTDNNVLAYTIDWQ